MTFPWKLPMLLGGYDVANFIPSGVCTEQWILEHPEIFAGFQSSFIKAGAQAVYTPTLSANSAHLRKFGLENKVAELNARLVDLTRRTADSMGIPVGGSVGPSGRFVPPHGDGDFDDLYDLYREQIRTLDEAGVDFIALESQNSLADMRVAVLAARTTDLPVFATLTLDEAGHTPTGGGLLPAVITLQAMGVDAIGLNGSFSPGPMLSVLKEVLPHASIPLIAKPNAVTEQRSGDLPLDPLAFAEEIRPLIQAGIAIVGGYRGISSEHIRALRRVVDEFEPISPAAAYEDADCYAAAIENEAFFLGEDIMFSDPIECSSGLSDDLIDLDDEQVNTALVEINTLDDVMLLSQSSTMTRLPIAVKTNNRNILEAALRYFQGRLIIDSNCDLDRELIEQSALKYGAIVY